jgi:mRNA interferase RelE/StbE
LEIVVTKTFVKQLKACPRYIQDAAKAVLLGLNEAKSLAEIPDIKKLEGYTSFHRIRIGDYRIGIMEQKPQVIIVCILHRGSIYKKFPPSK